MWHFSSVNNYFQMVFNSKSNYFQSLKERSLSTPVPPTHQSFSGKLVTNGSSGNNVNSQVTTASGTTLIHHTAIHVQSQQQQLSLPTQQRSYSHNDAQSPALQQRVLIEKQGGLSNHYVLYILFIWYLFSALTLFTNKYIVTYAKGNPTIIVFALTGAFQMTITSICGFVQLNMNSKKHRLKNISQTHPTLMNRFTFYFKFIRNITIIGSLRLTSIIFGLVALKYSTISFVETVKSSSPLFTVIISRVLIGEITGLWTNLSLIPIMIGLALCSSFDLNFSTFGLLAAIFTNVTECLQNVYSKILLCGENYKYTPLQVQFFTSFASMFVLVPACYFTVDVAIYREIFNFKMLLFFISNGIFFHGQSLYAFTLMSYISPITHSVLNTLKRTILIWVSILVFQTHVTYLSALGTCMAIVGVFVYNHIRHIEIVAKTVSKNENDDNSVFKV